MMDAQSEHIPQKGKRPAPADLVWLLPFALRGFFELVRARIAFSRLEAKAIPARNRAARESAASSGAIAPATLARITYVLPRLSDRLPWRSDCLVQAIAGQNWLQALGGASEIQIGVENPKDGDFGAHAWLMHDGEVITGGEIDRYSLILSESRLDPDSASGTNSRKPR